MAMMISACKMEATPMLIRAFSYSYKSLWGGTMGGSELEQRGIGKSRTFRDYLEAGGRQAKSNGHRNLHVHQRRGGGGRFILSNPRGRREFRTATWQRCGRMSTSNPARPAITLPRYFGPYLRYLPTSPTSQHCDSFPANPSWLNDIPVELVSFSVSVRITLHHTLYFFLASIIINIHHHHHHHSTLHTLPTTQSIALSLSIIYHI